jgi:hypothetical protein
MINVDFTKMLLEKLSSKNIDFSKLSFEDFLMKSLFTCSKNYSCVDKDVLVGESVVCFVNIIIFNAICDINSELSFEKKIDGYSIKWATKIMLKDIDFEHRLVDVLSRNYTEDGDGLTCYWAVYESGCDAKRETPRFISVLFVDGEPTSVFQMLYASRRISPCFVYLEANVDENKKGSSLFKAIKNANYCRRPSVICKGCNLEWDGYEKQNKWTSGDLTLWGDNRTYFVHDEVQLSTTKINIICKYKNNDSN